MVIAFISLKKFSVKVPTDDFANFKAADVKLSTSVIIILAIFAATCTAFCPDARAFATALPIIVSASS